MAKQSQRKTATTLEIRNIHTLHDFMSFVESHIEAKNSPLWYRGCADANHVLLPSLYRHPTTKDAAKLIELEGKILSRFKQRSVLYQHRSLVDKWEHLFYMQHFGVPTRLLDWTENPYIGLYFALCRAPDRYHDNTPIFENDAAVWVLNPVNWNRKVLEDISWSAEILSPPDDAPLSGYEPGQSSTMVRNLPVAIHGTYNSYRIVAQRGVFTIFGKSLIPMEQTYENLRFSPGALIKLVIPAERRAALFSSLLSIGITDSVVFPDLDGLAKETKRYFGFHM
jgi:FRG domain